MQLRVGRRQASPGVHPDARRAARPRARPRQTSRSRARARRWPAPRCSSGRARSLLAHVVLAEARRSTGDWHGYASARRRAGRASRTAASRRGRATVLRNLTDRTNHETADRMTNLVLERFFEHPALGRGHRTSAPAAPGASTCTGSNGAGACSPPTAASWSARLPRRTLNRRATRCALEARHRRLWTASVHEATGDLRRRRQRARRALASTGTGSASSACRRSSRPRRGVSSSIGVQWAALVPVGRRTADVVPVPRTGRRIRAPRAAPGGIACRCARGRSSGSVPRPWPNRP